LLPLHVIFFSVVGILLGYDVVLDLVCLLKTSAIESQSACFYTVSLYSKINFYNFSPRQSWLALLVFKFASSSADDDVVVVVVALTTCNEHPMRKIINSLVTSQNASGDAY
jgi:hypothetical protein